MPILNTGQIFSSGDQVTSQKLMDIADLATFSEPADGVTIIANNENYDIPAGDGKLKVPANGISGNELLSSASSDDNRAVTTDHIKDGAVTSDKLATTAISSIMPTGTVLPFAGGNLPNDEWLFCGGQSVAIADYQALYNTIGITYGGTGSNFNLPDLRGRVIAGKDDMNGLTASRLTSSSAANINGVVLGATGGDEEHQLTALESGLPAHNHDILYRKEDTSGGNQSGTDFTSASTSTHQTETNLGQSATNSHNNVQPTIILNYIIKT